MLIGSHCAKFAHRRWSGAATKCEVTGTQGRFRSASAVTVVSDNISVSTVAGDVKVADTGGSFTPKKNPLLG